MKSGSVLLQLLGGTRSSHALASMDQLLAAVFGRGHSRQAHRARHESRRCRNEAALLERNYVGTHFGGSLFAMTDAFYMLMLMANLGREYIVWDKVASIRYRKPGRGMVRAEFRLSDIQIDDIREKLKTLPQNEPMFLVEVKDEAGVVIAEVEKVLHVRKKQALEPSRK
jgi:hypothetical protein